VQGLDEGLGAIAQPAHPGLDDLPALSSLGADGFVYGMGISRLRAVRKKAPVRLRIGAQVTIDGWGVGPTVR
jgi:hypothetical protein